MQSKVFSKYDVITVGEVGYSDPENALQYVSAKQNEMNMIFLFDVMDLGVDPRERYDFKGWKLSEMKQKVQKITSFAQGTDGWTTAFLENHDQARSISRFANDTPEHRVKSAKLLCILLVSLTGTLFIYQGQELGMTNVPSHWGIEEYLDISTINYYNQYKEQHGPAALSCVMKNLQLLARDNARTPMQWNDSVNGGFSTGKPWMRVNDNHTEINANEQVANPDSVFCFYKEALKIRKQYKDVLIYGSLEILDVENEKTFSFLKRKEGKSAYIVLNFTSEELEFTPLVEGKLELILTNEHSFESSKLSPYGGRLYMLSG
ncbi:hypothetical protein JCM33374_g4402 [Metschnikowia sp. JCM 33374]|nr:hypothetical protein JCM33374_g4402 [Metschnikowia sp. JCM 33374]